MKEHLRIFWNRLVTYLGTMILSGIMGLIVWLIAIDQVNPLVTREYSDSINIVTRGLDPTLMPVQDLSKESVRVFLRAPLQTWDTIEPRDITAYIDLSNYAKGPHEIPIHVETNNNDIVVTSVDRRLLRVQLDEVPRRHHAERDRSNRSDAEGSAPGVQNPLRLQ